MRLYWTSYLATVKQKKIAQALQVPGRIEVIKVDIGKNYIMEFNSLCYLLAIPIHKKTRLKKYCSTSRCLCISFLGLVLLVRLTGLKIDWLYLGRRAPFDGFINMYEAYSRHTTWRPADRYQALLWPSCSFRYSAGMRGMLGTLSGECNEKTRKYYSCCAQHSFLDPFWRHLDGSRFPLSRWLISAPWSQTSSQQGAQ